MLTVLVVAADPLVRAGLAALLSAHDVTVVAELSPEDDVEAFVDASLDALVWEGELDGLPRVPVPLLALVSEGEEVNGALAAGATGVLFRSAGGERMAAALRAMLGGLVVLEPALTEFLGTETREDAPFGDLTPREGEVLGLLVEGLPNKVIAKKLDISEHTVKFHVNALLGKFGARTRTEVVARAVRSGWVTL